MYTDTDRCVRAVQSKDARFDGWFFTAVRTTGIYCRPSCPAVPPKVENMSFLPSAAACQQAGYRACKRCRPDTSPGSPEWNARADAVARAMRLIQDGVVDREGVPGLAARLGYSARQVERQLNAELGAGPLALARAQRAQTARLLIETSELPMGDVAFAAGFSSIRNFNETVREVFALTPGELRARAARAGRREPRVPGTLSLRLPYRAPLTPDNLFGHLVATAVPGVEEWRDGAYRRTLRLPHGSGIVALTPGPDHIGCRLALTDLRDLTIAISRCRWMLDLDADPEAVDDQLRTDPLLAPLVDKAPGRRVAPDRRRGGVRRTGGAGAAGVHRRRADPRGPAGERVRGARRGSTGRAEPPVSLPRDAGGARPRGAVDAAQPPHHPHHPGRGARGRLAAAGHRQRLGGRPGPAERPARFRALDHRGHRDAGAGRPDAFLPSDLGVRKAAQGLGLPSTPAALTARAAGWRPWRAYAVQYLWATDGHPINRMPAEGEGAQS